MDDVFGSDQLFVLSRSGSGHVWRFDITCGVLSKRPDLEVWKPIRGLREFCCVSYKYFIFIIGGYNVKLKSCVEHVKRYNVITNEWTDLPPMAMQRRMCTAVVYKNEIIVCGGFRSNNKLMSTTEVYSIKRRKWRKCSQMKKSKADHQLLVVEDSVIGVGGVQQVDHYGKSTFCASDDIYEYKDMTSGWQSLDDNIPLILGKPVYLHSIISDEATIYIIGGLKTVINKEGELSEVINEKVESLSLGNNQITSFQKNDLKGWVSPWDRSLPSPITPRYGAAVFMIAHDIYLLGGTGEAESSAVYTVERFNTKSCNWSKAFEIKPDGDLSMVFALTVFGSKYKSTINAYRSSLVVLSVSEDEDERNEVFRPNRYRVGWVLW